MASRPVFIAVDKAPFYKQLSVDFTYFSGFAVSQKQKSIASLHESIRSRFTGLMPLEISTKGTILLGVSLSAFNLQYNRSEKDYSIESIFQGSKVFEFGGPFVDLYDVSPKEAKRDERIKNSGKIIEFNLDGVSYVAEPKDYFYNWIYSSALYNHQDLLSQIVDYNAFTDIEFNPEKSINCQARTVAIVRGLIEAGMLDQAMKSPKKFLEIVYGAERGEKYRQLSLFDM